MVSISTSNLLPILVIHRSEMTIQYRQKASLIKACLLSITYYPNIISVTELLPVDWTTNILQLGTIGF